MAFSKVTRRIAATASLLALAACGAAPVATGTNDPQEQVNRERHEFNKRLDTAVIRPVSQGYGRALPQPVRTGVSNFANNLDLPGDVLNGVFQGRPVAALENTGRFLVNSTIGILGIFDPASSMGLRGKPTDFGETLYTWGVGEGQYVEHPFFGPSTERDTYGAIVDFATNPVRAFIGSPESYAGTVAEGGSKLGDRYEYSDTIDGVLYESADSYAQARLLYLQNRRYSLGQAGGQSGGAMEQDDFIDPYSDAAPATAPAPASAPADFIDPYEE